MPPINFFKNRFCWKHFGLWLVTCSGRDRADSSNFATKAVNKFKCRRYRIPQNRSVGRQIPFSNRLFWVSDSLKSYANNLTHCHCLKIVLFCNFRKSLEKVSKKSSSRINERAWKSRIAQRKSHRWRRLLYFARM